MMVFLIIDDMDDMEWHPPHPERQKLINSAVALSSIAAQFVVSLLMASSQQEKASWNDEETLALVDYLCEHRSESGDGGTFKDSMFNAVAEHIAPHLTSGPAKTAKHCKTKYNSVSKKIIIFHQFFILTDIVHSSKPPFER